MLQDFHDRPNVGPAFWAASRSPDRLVFFHSVEAGWSFGSPRELFGGPTLVYLLSF